MKKTILPLLLSAILAAQLMGCVAPEEAAEAEIVQDEAALEEAEDAAQSDAMVDAAEAEIAAEKAAAEKAEQERLAAQQKAKQQQQAQQQQPQQSSGGFWVPDGGSCSVDEAVQSGALLGAGETRGASQEQLDEHGDLYY